MSDREAFLVGSLPGQSAAEAMTTALGVLGSHLRFLPDGETGERNNWILPIVESLRDHPDLEVRRSGDWSDYDRTTQLRVRRGHRLYGATMDFGHLEATRESFPQFQEVAAKAGRPDLAFQQGVPGDLDLALFTLGPVAGLRHRRAFTEATLAQMRGVAALTGPTTLFQVEVPVELVMMAKAPAPARPALATLLAKGIIALAAAAAPGTRFAVHLCLGDMNNRAYGTMTDVAPLVVLANAIWAGWPQGRPLEVMHAPFAAADEPPSTDSAFYAPLRQLRVGPDVRFAAGFAHESAPLADQQRVRGIIEDLVGHEVAVSSACGFGRRDAATGRALLERTGELCTS